MTALDPRVRVRNDSLLQTAARIPELRVGDEWEFVHGFHPRKFKMLLKITGFAEIEPNPDGTMFPWPMVHICVDGIPKEPRGAPGFLHGKLKKRGRGKKWSPPAAAPGPEPRAASRGGPGR